MAKNSKSPLALLRLIEHRRWSSHQGDSRSDRRGGEKARLHDGRLILLDWDAHVSTIATLAAIALVLADALLCRQSSILATTARALTIATFLALAATLTARLAGQVWLLIIAKLRDLAAGSNRLFARSSGGSRGHGHVGR